MFPKRTHIVLITVTYLFGCYFASCDLFDDEQVSKIVTSRFQEEKQIMADTLTRRFALADTTLSVYTFSIEDGNNIVFTYNQTNNPPPDVLDGGFSETLVFQLSPESDVVTLKNGDLPDSPVLYRRSCFCPESGAVFKVEKGLLTGSKLAETVWEIDADLTLSLDPLGPDSVHVSFNSIFVVDD